MSDCNCKHGANGTGRVCPACDIPQMARNNYFTGKLLVERDFTDEQHYTMGKLRRHNQKLHGWGVACGFKVKQHPNPACQSQYVVIDPGTAIDCCGREIVSACQDYFDFEAKFLANWQRTNGPNSTPSGAHTIGICVSYKECATENVPALFDECSDPGACRPNRILEGHDFDVLIDPRQKTADPGGVKLAWDFTKNIANVIAVAENDTAELLCVLAGSANKSGVWSTTLYVIDTTNYSLTTSVSIAKGQGLDVAFSAAGDFVYVAVQPSSGAPQVYVYSVSDFTATVNQVTIGTAADTSLRLAVFPGTDGSLFAYGATANVVACSGMNAAGPSTNAVASITAPTSLVVGQTYAYYAAGSAEIGVITLSSMTVTANIALATAPQSLALAATTGGETLAALDKTGPTLYFVSVPTAGPGSAGTVGNPVTGFANSPIGVLLSPGGNWAYVLEQDSSTPPKGYVQTVDEHAVESGTGTVLGSVLPVSVGPLEEVLSQDGTHLYIASTDSSQPNMGGVAIVDVTQANCGAILDSLICCPDCDTGDCLVLATITNYVYQNAVTDSEIDNLTDRRLLASTDVLTNAVRCLISQGGGTGGSGPQGPVGPSGPPGATGATGPTGIPGGMGSTGPQGVTGPTGVTGPIGPTGPGLEQGLVRITNLSWTHGQAAGYPGGIVSSAGGFIDVIITTPTETGTQTGLVIGFSNLINIPSTNDSWHIFEVLCDPEQTLDVKSGFRNPRPVVGTVYAVSLPPGLTPGQLIVGPVSSLAATATQTQALAFVPGDDLAELAVNTTLDVWVRLRGDFLLDTNTPPRAISAEFVRGLLTPDGTGERPQGSGLYLEGGTFESWMTLVPQPTGV